MIRMIHGDDIVASRKKLGLIIESEREKGKEVIRIDGETSISEILMSVRSSTLFWGQKLVVIEDFFSSRRSVTDELEAILKSAQGDVFIWEGREISSGQLKVVRKFTKDISVFKIRKEVFKFLDNLQPGNAKVTVKLLRSVVSAGDAPEFLLFMMSRQVRLLLWAKLDPDSLILAPWQRTKILNQARLWGEGELMDFHSKLVELDRGNKQSRLAVDLATSLELLLF